MRNVILRLKNLNNGQKIFWLTVLALLILINLPIVFGYINSDENNYYTGNQVHRGLDMYGYFTFINQAAEGKWLFKLLYTPQVDQQALFFHPLWSVTGWLMKIFSLSAFAVFHLVKNILAILFCLVLRKFLSRFYDYEQNPWQLPFITFSGGFYTWIVEKDVFLSLYLNPLFVLTLIFFLLLVHWSFEYFRSFKPGYLYGIFIIACLLFLSHFYDTVTLLLVLFAFGIYHYFKKRQLKLFLPWLVCGLAVGLGAVYYYFIFSIEPALNRWAVNNVTLIPSWHYLILGMGLLLPLAAIGIYIKRADPRFHLLGIWVLAHIYLNYSSIPFNRRLVLGIGLPLSILAYQGASFLLGNFKSYIKKTIFAAILILALTYQVLFYVAMDMVVISRHYQPAYLSRQGIDALFWMRDNLPHDRLVFANTIHWDLVISGYTQMHTYLAGGNFYSLDNESKPVIEKFFKEPETGQKEFLCLNNFSYFIYFSETDQILGNYNPSAKEYLKPIYKNKNTVVYEVINCP